MRVDGEIKLATVDKTGPQLVATLSMTGRTVTALPCGCLLAPSADGEHAPGAADV